MINKGCTPQRSSTNTRRIYNPEYESRTKNKKPLVYIAGAYSRGSKEINIRIHFGWFTRLLNDGIVTPFAPLANEAIHSRYPQEYDKWLSWDCEILRHCDALFTYTAILIDENDNMVYRIDDSKGRDEEIEFANANQIPHFTSIGKLYDWAMKSHPKNTE